MFIQGGAVPHPFLMSILEHFKPNLQIDLNFSIKSLYIPNFCCTFAVAKVFTMEDNFAIQLFEGKKVRIVWDETQEKYWFSVVDIVQVLTGSFDYQQARKYWKVLKGRLIKEGNETVTNCYQLKLPAVDGKKRLTDVADLQGIFRIIQSIPSKKAA